MKKYTLSSSAIIIFCIVLVSMINSGATTAHQPSDYEILGSFENALINVVEKSMPAIVSISTQKTHIHEEIPIKHSSAASGFLFREDGYIFTNEHVVEDAKNITVRLHDGTSYDARIIGADKNTDVAVIKIDTQDVCPVLTMADPRNIRVGQLVIAIGDPLEYRYTVTSGVVSGKNRCYHPHEDRDLFQYHYNYIQTDAWIHPGSSGGPLLNIHGEVIGINTLKQGEGSTFAVSCNIVETIGQKLIAHGRVIRGWIDADMRDGSSGIKIMNVNLNSAASRSGLKQNDIILEYDGEKVPNTYEFQKILMEYSIGKKCDLKVLRNSQEITLNIPIEEIPPKLVGRSVDTESAAWKKLGLVVRELGKDDHLRYDYLTSEDRGLVVEQVNDSASGNDSSPGFNAKILKGMLIVAIDGQAVVDAKSLETVLLQKQEGSDVTLDVKGSNGEITLNVSIEAMPPKLVERSVDTNSTSWKKLGLAVRELGKDDHLRYDYLTSEDEGLIIEDFSDDLMLPPNLNLKDMLIVAIDGQAVVDAKSLETVLLQKQEGSDVILDVKGSNGLKAKIMLLRR